MKLLFIHQNFPGQYLRLVSHLRDQGGHVIYGVGDAENIKRRGTVQGITTIAYPVPRGPGEGTHHYLKSTEAAVRRGQSVARCLLALKRKGFAPDVICAHPGWGEALFLRDVYPGVPIVLFCEFYFRPGEGDVGFDPEFPFGEDKSFAIRIRNTPQIMSLMDASACVSPTQWQASRYPAIVRPGIRVIHEGVDTAYMCPDRGAVLHLQPTSIPGESRVTGYPPPQETGVSGEPCEPEPRGPVLTLSAADKIITYVSRNLEPYRGYHIFMRSLPALQRLHPDAHVLIVGGDGVSYSPPPEDGRTYKARYLDELRDSLDLSRIHFLGKIPYGALRALFRISSAHVYLTYPFVLSWSTLEAMACGALLVASSTEPVREVVTDGENGLLVDFFDTQGLVDRMDAVLRAPGDFAALRCNARRTVVELFTLAGCLERHVNLLYEMHTDIH